MTRRYSICFLSSGNDIPRRKWHKQWQTAADTCRQLQPQQYVRLLTIESDILCGEEEHGETDVGCRRQTFPQHSNASGDTQRRGQFDATKHLVCEHCFPSMSSPKCNKDTSLRTSHTWEKSKPKFPTVVPFLRILIDKTVFASFAPVFDSQVCTSWISNNSKWCLLFGNYFI